MSIAVLKPGKPSAAIAKELETLAQLKRLGYPITNITGVTHVNGRSAMMMNKYALGSKDIVQIVNGKHTIVGASKQLNQTTIKDLEKLKQKLLTDNIQIDDLQFLIDGSGNVVINDPRAILVGNGKPPIKNFRVINKLIKASRKNI